MILSRPFLAAAMLAGALAPPAAFAQGTTLPLGKNLAGEDCVQTPARAPSPGRIGVICAGAAEPAAQINLLEQRREPRELLSDQALLRDMAPGVACAGQPRELPMPPGAPALVLACAATEGGWPRFVLAARRGSDVFYATGFTNALDLVRQAIVAHADGKPAPAPAEGDDARRRIAELEAAVGGSLSAIGMQDVDKFGKLRELGDAYNSLRDYPRAEDAWRRALDMQERALGAANPALGDTLGHLALNIANQRRFAEAETLFQRAEPLTKRSGDPDHLPRLLVYRGFVAELKGQLPQALALVAESTRLRREHPESVDALAHSLYAESGLAMKSGDLARAARAVAESRSSFTAAYGGVNWWVAETLELQAEIAVRAKRLDEARQYNTQLIAMRETLFGPSRPLARAFAQAAEIEQAAGKNDAALAAWRRMAGVVVKDRRARADASPDEFASYVLAALRRSRNDPKNAAALTDEAFRAAQLPRPGATAQAIAQMSLRLAAATPALGAVTRELQDVYARLDASRQELAGEMSKPADQRTAVVEDALKRRVAEQSARVEALDKRLTKEFPDYAQLQSPEPAPAAALAKLLKPGEALLSMMVSDQGTVVFLLRDGRLRAHGVNLKRDALEAIVRQLRLGLDWTRSQPDFDLDVSHRLYKALLQPLEPALDGVKQLIVVPAGAMLALPPAVLVAKPAPAGGYAEADWLVRRYAVSVMPSIEAFRALRTAQVRSAPQPFIGFGAPNFTGGIDGALGELGATCRDKTESIMNLVRQLPPLPETAGELRAMARALNAPADSVKLGGDATEEHARAADLSQYRVVAFATHGLLPGDLPCDIEPALALTPPAKVASTEDNGLLDASEIATLKLNADFVVLSACNTASPDGRLGGDSLSGLTRAFFYAGARSVYASSFPVPSDQTAELTSAMFAALAAEPALTRAEAARRAQLKLIGQRDIAHPVFWSGFVLIGD